MSRNGVFGWSYPAGCSGPPEYDDPHPKSIELYDLLEAAGCTQEVIDKACHMVEEIAASAERECPYCAKRQDEEAMKAEKEFHEEQDMKNEVVEALLRVKNHIVYGHKDFNAIDNAIFIAEEQAEKADALEWLVENRYISGSILVRCDCPTIIKQMIERKP